MDQVQFGKMLASYHQKLGHMVTAALEAKEVSQQPIKNQGLLLLLSLQSQIYYF
jgi:hypothetical protein